MNEKDFQRLIDYLDETVLKPFLDDIYQKSAEHYNKLMLEGESSEEALHDVICKTAYITLKHAAAFVLFLGSDYDPDKPKSKEELKKIFKLIKG